MAMPRELKAQMQARLRESQVKIEVVSWNSIFKKLRITFWTKQTLNTSALSSFFVLLVALHFGESRVKVSSKRASLSPNKNNLVINVSEEKLRAARMLAAMKFLDQIETDWRAENDGQEPTMDKMAKLKGYEEIYNEIILKNGGWYRIRHLQSIRDLEDDLSKPRRQARSIARIIEFSCRFVPNPSRPKHLGGVTMATDIVTTTKYFKVAVKDSTLEEWWKDRQSAAPFLYLIYVQKYPFRLNKIVGRHFARRYLAKINDCSSLSEFLFAYNSVVRRLSTLGYRYTPLLLPDLPATGSVSFDPFRDGSRPEREVLDAIDDYRK